MKDGIRTGYKLTHLNHTFRHAVTIHFYMSVNVTHAFFLYAECYQIKQLRRIHIKQAQNCAWFFIIIIIIIIITAEKSMLTITFPASTLFLALFVTSVFY